MTISLPQTFEPDGRALRFVDEGEGPVLVLLPARGMNITALGMLAGVLEEEGFRVIRVDARRPGEGAAATMHDLAQDVVDVLDHLDIGTAWIGGHAFGGAVARTIALDHADRVEGVLLLGVEEAEQPDADAARALESAFAGGDTAAAMRVLAGEAADLEFVAEVFSRARDLVAAPLQAAALAATPVAEWATLPASLPVLIVQGSADRVTPPEAAERLRASAADRASVAVVDGGGHLFVLTHPGEVGFQIEDYLAWD